MANSKKRSLLTILSVSILVWCTFFTHASDIASDKYKNENKLIELAAFSLSNSSVSSSDPNTQMPPLPSASISGDTTVCQNDTEPLVTFTGSAGTAPYTFTYNINGESNQTVITTSGSSVTVNAPTNIDGTFIYNLVSVLDDAGDTQVIPGSVTITVDPQPTASSGGSQTICSNSTASVSGASSSNGTILWSHDGSGSISDATTLTPTYTPISADAGNTVTLTMTVTSNNACNPQSTNATYSVNVEALPTASSGGSQTICSNSTASVSGASSSNGTILWSHDGSGSISDATTLTPTYTPVVADAGNTITLTMTVTSNNACNPQSTNATYSVNVEALPTASAGGSQTICSNSTATVSGASASNGIILWSHDGSGSISDATTLTPTYTPVVADAGNTITLTMTVTSNNACNPQSTNATYSVNVEALPTASAGGSQTICPDGTSIVSGASATNGSILWTHDGSGSISDATTLTPTYSAVGADAGTTVILTITVTSTNACAPQASTNTYTVDIHPTPTINDPGTQTHCQLSTIPAIPLTGSPSGVVFDISGGTSIGIADATDVTEIASFLAITAGSATLSITPKANGCTGAPINVEFNITEIPLVQTNPSARTICSGESTNILLGSTTTGTTFNWVVTNIDAGISGASDDTGNHIDQVLENNSGTTGSVTYQITASANSCAGGSIPITITVHPKITATIIGGSTICQNDSEPVITFTATGGSGPYTFTYNINGGANQQVTASSGNTTTIDAPTNNDGTFNYNLTSISGSENCNYSLNEITTVTVNPQPNLTSTLAPSGVCSNEAFNYTPTSDILGTTFSWSRSLIAGITNPAETGTNDPDELLENTTNAPIAVTYTYTLQTPAGCINTQDVVIMVTPTPILTSPDPSDPICSGETFSYTPTSNVISGVNYSWSRPSIAGNPAASGTGAINETLINNTGSNVGINYTYTLSSNDCVNPVTYTVPVVVVPAPNVTASASETIICPGESVNLFSSSDITSTQPPTLLSEDFNSASVGATNGPNGWTTTNTSSGGDIPASQWTIRPDNYTTAGAYNTTISSNDNLQFYLSDSDDQGSGTTRTTLVSPQMNTTGYTDLQLEFYQYFRDYSGSYCYVEVSTNGTSWTTIETYNFTQGGSTSFDHETISLNGYIGNATFYVRFRYQATWGYYWAIDNIEVTGTPSAVANINWTSNPAGFTSTVEDPTNISPSETTTYTATYTDPDTGCDGSESVTVTVQDTPEATITSDYCVASPKIRLTTTAGYASYDWSPLPSGATNGNNYVDVDLAGDYSVTVVDANGCTGTGNINVGTQNEIDGNFTNFNPSSPDFYTEYNQHQSYYSGNSSTGLWPEGDYAVNTSAWSNYPSSPSGYHPNFHGEDHTNNTSGDRNFLMVNGSTTLIEDPPGTWRQRIIWQRTITVKANTDYYFSAWAMNLNPTSPAELQFEINGVLVGTIADLDLAAKPTSEGEVDVSNWVRFYSDPLWNSGSETTAVIRIRNLNTVAGGNDFGIDDISFGELNPSPAEIDSVSVNEDICHGGDIEFHSYISEGREPITYLWTGPNGFSSTDENPIITPADPSYPGDGDHTYTLNVSDWYGCSIDPVSVTLTIYPIATTNAGGHQTVCSDSPVITLNGTIGGAAISSTWSSSGTGTFDSPSSLTPSYTPSADDITNGGATLSLTTDDPTGPCPAMIGTMTLTINPSPILTIDVTVPTCNGNTNGEATVNVSSGTAPFTYLWSDGQTNQTATDLDDGTYTVTVTDTNGCIITSGDIEIIEPEILLIQNPSYISTSPSCYGGTDGTSTIQVDGGTPPYKFTWLDAPGSQTTQTATGLSDGIYWFTVTDANDCNMQSGFAVVTDLEDTELICPLTPTPVQTAPLATTADVTLGDPIYDPACQTITWTMSGANIVSTPTAGFVPSPYTFNVGTTTIEYEVTNTAGEIQTCTFDVVVLPNDPPDIGCIDPAPSGTDTDLCTADLSIGLPTINAGDNISWDWEMTGATIATGTGSIPDPYTFNIDTTYISWTATNVSGTDICTQMIIVNDNQLPTFTTATPIEECVELISQAIFNAPTTDINPDRPEYYIFTSGSTELDLDPLSFADNCDLSCGPEIRWRIDFSDGTALPSTNPATFETGQPSTYGSDIQFLGDGITFANVTHTVTYWIVDCHGNASNPQQTTVTVKPRPRITKQN